MLESDPFTVDNTPPEIVDATSHNDGSHRVFMFTARDALTWIDKAEYSLNGGDWILLTPTNKVTDSQTLSYMLTVDEPQLVTVRVFDEDDNVVVKQLAP